MPSSTKPTTPRQTPAPVAGDRDNVVESLLVAGLDAYFAGDYDGAIHAWTRVLFVDRGHARARAYIERARAVLAERQRKTDELVHGGVAAFEEGDAGRARELLSSALATGSSDEVALALLQRLDRLGTPGHLEAPGRSALATAELRGVESPGPGQRWGVNRWIIGCVGAMLAVAIALTVGWDQLVSWAPRAPAVNLMPRSDASAARLPLPRTSDLVMRQARALYARGHLHDALVALARVKADDPRRAEAEALRGEIQRVLFAAVVAAPPEIRR